MQVHCCQRPKRAPPSAAIEPTTSCSALSAGASVCIEPEAAEEAIPYVGTQVTAR